jgi:hypothetical protein
MASLSFCGKRKRWPAFLTRRDSSAKRDGLALLGGRYPDCLPPHFARKIFSPTNLDREKSISAALCRAIEL